MTTDARGNAVAVVPVASVPGAFDSLSLALQWVGPTRERLYAAATVSIRKAAVSMTLSASLASDVPLQRFAVDAALRGVVTGLAVTGHEIRVTAGLLGDNECAAMEGCAEGRVPGASFALDAPLPRLDDVCVVQSPASGASWARGVTSRPGRKPAGGQPHALARAARPSIHVRHPTKPADSRPVQAALRGTSAAGRCLPPASTWSSPARPWTAWTCARACCSGARTLNGLPRR